MAAPARIGSLTVLSDFGCPMCVTFAGWLRSQPVQVPLEIIPAGSSEARARFPRLDHAQTLRDLTVVADTGEYWTNGAGWVTCLWATASHRDLALSLCRPGGLALAKAAAYAAAGIHARTTRTRLDTVEEAEGPGGYGECRDGTCAV